jgi:hypothetical protein
MFTIRWHPVATLALAAAAGVTVTGAATTGGAAHAADTPFVTVEHPDPALGPAAPNAKRRGRGWGSRVAIDGPDTLIGR